MHNLGTVFRFEIIRTLKKKTFWFMALGFPIMMAAIFVIVYFSNNSTIEAAEEMANQEFSIAITDNSGVVNDIVIDQIGASQVNDKASTIQDVTDGKLDAYFYYPSDLVNDNVEIYAKDINIFNNSRYQAVAKNILSASVLPTIDETKTAILQNTINYQEVLYKDGAQSAGFKDMIAPGIFLVLFFIILSMFSNQMLTSTTEEKEDRIIEIILTTVKAKTLIIGKILSLIVLAFMQVLIILIPVAIAYFFFWDKLALPNFDLASIPIDPVRTILGLVIFIFSFLLFTGILVTISSAVPTAKEASGFFGIIILLIFGPLYSTSLFLSSPDSPIVRFLSYFPLTSPVPLMLRNAIGNLSTQEAMIGISILVVSAILIFMVAIRVFQYGALEYSRRISLKSLLKKP